MRKDNPFSKNYFEELEVFEKMIKEPNINQNDRKNIEDKVKDIYKKLSSENSFFSNIESFEAIFDKIHYDIDILFKFMSSIIFGLFGFLSIKPIMNNRNIETFKGFNIVKLSNEDDKSKKEIKNNIELLEKPNEFIDNRKGILLDGKMLKKVKFFL